MEYTVFYINEKPYTFWDQDIKQINAEFLNGIVTDLLDHAVDSYLKTLDHDINAKHEAFLTLRLMYFIGLETMLSVLCTIAQAKHSPIGWMLRSRSDDLWKVTEKITYGIPLKNTFKKHSITWRDLAEQMFSIPADNKTCDVKLLMKRFGEFWSRNAKEYLNDSFLPEFNSIKHGIRCKSCAGLKLVEWLEEKPGQIARNSKPTLIGFSKDGVSFFNLHRIENYKDNLYVEKKYTGLNPDALRKRLELIKISIDNSVTYLRIVNKIPGNHEYAFPNLDENFFDQVWSQDSGVKFGVTSSPPEPVTKEEMIKFFDDRWGV